MLQTNRFLNLSRAKKKDLSLKIRRLITSSVNTEEDIPHLLQYVFTKNFNYGLHSKAMDYVEKTAIVSNISHALKEIRLKEHQSGAFRAIVAATCGNNIKKKRTAYQLKISKNSVTRVK